MKKTWAVFDKNQICHVQTVVRKSDTGHIWAKKHQIRAAFMCRVNVAIINFTDSDI